MKNLGSLAIKILISAIAVVITAFLTPGFSISGNLLTIVVAAVVIAALDYLVNLLFKENASSARSGIAGFLIAAAVLYITGQLVQGLHISIIGALIGALIYGVVEGFLTRIVD